MYVLWSVYLDEEFLDVGETVREQEQLRLHLPEQLDNEVLLHRHAHVVHQPLGRYVPVGLRSVRQVLRSLFAVSHQRPVGSGEIDAARKNKGNFVPSKIIL